MGKKTDASQLDFLTPLSGISGIGPKRRTALETSGIRTVGELLHYFPIRYVDRSHLVRIVDAGEFGNDTVTVRGTVWKKRTEFFGRPKQRVTVRDDSGTMEVVWYYRAMGVEEGDALVLTGKVTPGKNKLMMFHPVFEKIDGDGGARPVLAVYSIKEAMREAGISQRMLRGWMEQALDTMRNYPMALPRRIEEKHNFPPLAECLRQIHLPDELAALDKYRARLKYEELYRLALNLRWNRKKFALPGRSMTAGGLDAKLRAVLPFELTESQERAVKILYDDAAGTARMHRLLQGDVGSGKTITALMASLPALGSGRQVAWMAPTETLARQTKSVVEKYLGQLNIKTAYLGAGDMRAKESIRAELASGELRFVVGTHALFMPSVNFFDLGMVIIDEQHKFGAGQRLKLQEKGPASDFLLMSATPIPQTLAKTLYGDLDTVEIKSRPGRAQITTRVVPSEKRGDMEKFILEQITGGARVFYVVPRIDQQTDDANDGGEPADKNCDDEPAVKTVDSVAERIARGVLAHVPLRKLHGQMPYEEREEAISAFRDGPPGILVATTIIEVGVDISDAAVMVIENPEYFGLAQLHQIRGRVGRGGKTSYCFLLPGEALTGYAAERLKFICGCSDGFEIADWDLKHRGPGDAAGSRQSGWDDLQTADILEDAELFREIMRETEELFC